MQMQGPSMRVAKGVWLTLTFRLFDESGELLDDTHERTPIRLVFGKGPFPPGFYSRINGLAPGDTAAFTLPPEEAFGPYRPSLVEKVHVSELPNPPTEVGQLYRRLYEDCTSECYTVRGFVGDWVHLDKNHPLAGRSLRYAVKIHAVGPAGPVEIK
jgi:FKBP-type peptidyl-prolyl cis-trans isomerase 2